MMVMSSIPFSAFASSESGIMLLKAEEVPGVPGNTVDVKISLENNPGVSSLKFNVHYDSNLTLTDVQFNSKFGQYVSAAKPYSNPQIISMMSPLSNIDGDGVFATLTFMIDENAEDDYAADIKLTYDDYEIFDVNLEQVDMQVQNGSVRIYHGRPGDINADGIVTNADAILSFRYNAGWNVTVDKDALDVNRDGKSTNADSILIFRYNAGWPVTLWRGKVHTHTVTAVAAKEATCTENGNTDYWICSECGKYFADMAGSKEILPDSVVIKASHHLTHVERKEATTYSEGNIEYWTCSSCGKYFLDAKGNSEIPYEETVIPKVAMKYHTITYDISNGDSYIEKQQIQNTNPSLYYENEGLTLKNISLPGYRFLGWYDGAGENAVQIKKIPADATDDYELCAHWQKIEYTVQLKSDVFIDTNTLTYTVDTGVALPTPKLSNYVFTGWTDESGHLYKNTAIPSGTIGNMYLTANWTSERNKTWTKTKLDAPVIVEDENNIVFAYEIGQIQNVPLYTIHDFGYISGDGITKTATEEYSVQIDDTLMQTYTKSVSNATTESSNWSLSSSWNDTTTVNEEWARIDGKDISETDVIAKNSESNWNVSSGRSGSTETSTITTNNKGWENQVQMYKNNEHSVSDGTSDKKYDNKAWNINAKLTYTPKSYSAGIGVEGAKVEAGVSGGLGGEIGGGYEHKWGTEQETTHNETDTTKSGFELSGKVNASTSTSTSSSSSASWNSSNSYGGSSSVSQSKANSVNLSEKISQAYGYGSEYAKGEEHSSEQGHTSTQKYDDGYSSSVTYSVSTQEKKTNTWTTQATKPGYHRWIVAGTAHVFGVVGYNTLTKSFYVYTYSVMDDETHEFEDYSYTSSAYNDNENGVIPFDIPYEVAEYVKERTCASDGLKVDLDTGIVTEYNGSDTCVVIPEYFNTDSGDVIKITGIAPTAFQGNTNIESVVLSDFITEIPEKAFMNCTSLIGISGGNIQKIGAYAFSGCTSAKECGILSQVEYLGDRAFEGVSSIIVNAANADVVKAAANSGAKDIIICLEYVKDNAQLKNESIVAPEGTRYFELNGNKDHIYENLSVQSGAQATAINKVNLECYGKIPLKIYSDEIVLNQSSAKANGLAAVFFADNVRVGLQGTVSVVSDNHNALLCKQMDLYEANSKVVGKLSVTDTVLACADIVNQKLMSGQVQIIEADQFDMYLNALKVTFDANGGSVSEKAKTVYYGQPLGELPVPTRTGYAFVGWYTDPNGGTKVTESTPVATLENQTYYAHWDANAYTLSYDGNGGYGIPAAQAKYHDTALQISTTVPARTGYTFKSWLLSGSDKTYRAGDYFYENQSGVLVAQWTPNTYTVYFNGNGGNPAYSSKSVVYTGYYGDLPSASRTGYTFTGWYTSSGSRVNDNSTQYLIAGDQTLYAYWSANDYTYSVVYKSSNGTNLGSESVTHTFGATYTVYPGYNYSGYSTPAAQSVAWDATSKIITFVYAPNSVAATQLIRTGTHWTDGNGVAYLFFDEHIEYRNRTASTIEMRVAYTLRKKKYYYDGYPHSIKATIGGVASSNVTVLTSEEWGKGTSAHNKDASKTVYSNWVTVPVSATTTSVNVTLNSYGYELNKTFNDTATIPTY